jgi:hypothetical protein
MSVGQNPMVKLFSPFATCHAQRKRIKDSALSLARVLMRLYAIPFVDKGIFVSGVEDVLESTMFGTGKMVCRSFYENAFGGW